MDASEKDEVPMLSGLYLQLDENTAFQSRKLSSRTRSAISAPRSPVEPYVNENNFTMGHTGPLRTTRNTAFIQMSGPLNTSHNYDNPFRPTHDEIMRRNIEASADIYSSLKSLRQEGWQENHGANYEHLLRSGPLGMCSDPYCTTCPVYYNGNGQQKPPKYSLSIDSKFHNVLYGDAKGWARRMYSHMLSYIPGVMNPHTKVIQQWNKFFVISCLFAIFLDPLFFFLLSVQKEHKCIVINLPFTTTLVSLRSLTDFIYLINMLLQFRLAYIAPESRVVGAGELVDHPKKIAMNYLKGYFIIDVLVALPLPQIVILLIIPSFVGSSGANNAKNLLRTAVLIQYIPRLARFLPFFAGRSPNGFIFESAWGNFVINLLTFVLAGHVVGSLWYLFGLQRVNQCLRHACHDSGNGDCKLFIDCGHGNNIDNFKKISTWKNWTENINATACFDHESFPYGIYLQAANLTTEGNIVTRYIYSLFWGFQQISTLAGNQVPSYNLWEVLFTMGIIGLGLLLFALLIGNMQNFLQALGRRRLEMSLRRRDVELWMSHRRLPEELRRQVRQAERYNWASTRGVNEEILLEKLPEDLQIEIRRHLFNSIRKVRIFAMMDEPILDAICAKLRQRTYIKGSRILHRGGLIEKMVFIVRGKMESIEDNIKVPLSEGDVCGEELLRWCLEHSSVNRDGNKVRLPGPKLLSNRMISCFTNVEAFTLRAADLEEVTSLFSRFLRNPRVQGAIRYESTYWRCLAAQRIQVAWRYRKKRIQRAETSGNC